jgi:site-specific DNA-methyltransferase (adenine-specific)
VAVATEILEGMIELLNTDCMEYMATLPDKAFDLAIVDPPYGIGATGGTGKYGRLKFQGKKACWDTSVPSAEYFAELERVAEHRIVWGANYFGLPPSRCFLVWDKGQGFKGRDFAEAEYAWTSFDANARVFAHDPLAARDYIGKIHPTQKPVALYRWLLNNYAKPGQRILDTHGGSMSIAIACDIEGFDLTLCEIDKDYFDAGKKRLELHQSQPRLFDALEKVAPVQLTLDGE